MNAMRHIELTGLHNTGDCPHQWYQAVFFGFRSGEQHPRPFINIITIIITIFIYCFRIILSQ